MEKIRKVNEFHGNDFSSADLDDCSFVDGIDFDANRMPTGPDYVHLRGAKEKIARARSRLHQIADPHERQLVAIKLDILAGGGFADPDLFMKRSELGPALPLLLEDQ